MFSISNLSDCPHDYVDILAAWDYGHWGFRRDYATLENTIQFYTSARGKGFPFVFVAYNEDKNIPLGMVTLMEEDIHAPARPECSPYFVSLYVQERFRHSGIAEKLVNRTENFTHHLGFKHLYCNTRHAARYLKQLGWGVLEGTHNKENEPLLHFMKKSLSKER